MTIKNKDDGSYQVVGVEPVSRARSLIALSRRLTRALDAEFLGQFGQPFGVARLAGTARRR